MTTQREQELEARVAELEEALKSILDEAEDYNKRNPTKLVTWYEEHAKTLNRQPAQSLDMLRAQVLREAAKIVRSWPSHSSPERELLKEANRLEQGEG